MPASVPASHITAVLGHGNLRMTERYAHVAAENAEAAVAKLDDVPNVYPLNKSAAGLLRKCLSVNGGSYWDRTSGPCRVKAVLYR